MKTELASIFSRFISERQLADPSAIDEILLRVSENPSMVEATWHPLGFIRLKLASTPQGTLRIHIWPGTDRKSQSPSWNIHDHLFDLRSSILCGVVENHRFAVRPDRKSATHRLYQVSYCENQSLLHATTTEMSCHHLGTEVYSALDSYQVYREQFHASVVEKDILAATIVVTSDHSQRPPNVLGDLTGAKLYFYNRRPCTPDYVSRLVGAVRSEFSANLAYAERS
ncbi:MAG: hypothetical protein QOG23_1396 [Blastocatellia bacterium]|nr:hypothetical protein [Blastocatellia bacterium]